MKAYQDSLSSNISQDTLITERTSVELGALYEPPPVAFSFEPIGWSILAGIIVLAILLMAFFLIRNYIKNHYRREALHALEDMQNNGTAFTQIFVLLKQVALKTFGREKVGRLYGKEWLQFLEKTGKDVKMLAYEKQFEDVLYKGKRLSESQQNELLFNARKWIKTHGNTR
ncbi:DUF4381 domain-containing protein [Catalinimonas sp. 4WD22]|uniref:DUF4381 domain-containing protein n=1 Tax=Catalinimonas locisalis TaxID=3133978 RepID=UPI003100F4B0